MSIKEQYSNKHLKEVNCGFRFPKETVKWDSTFFGQFFDKVKVHGFVQRQERKGIEIKFGGEKSNFIQQNAEVESEFVFRNNSNTYAILMGRNKVSFHSIKNYPGWNTFVSEFIMPITEIYKSLGLGNGVRDCSIIYLNSFVKEQEVKLHDYFKIVSRIDIVQGIEKIANVQRIFHTDTNDLIAKLNAQIQGNQGMVINYECGAVCTSTVQRTQPDWLIQAEKTHAPIKDFFEETITQKLREEL